MKLFEKFDFSKKNDQEKLNNENDEFKKELIEDSHEIALEINKPVERYEKPEKVEEDECYKIRQEKKQELTERYSDKQSPEKLKAIISTIIAVRMDTVFGWLPEDEQNKIEKQLKKEYQEKYSVLLSDLNQDSVESEKLYERLIKQAIHYSMNNWQEYEDHEDMQEDLKWESEKEEKEKRFLRDLLMHKLLSKTKLKDSKIIESNSNISEGRLFAKYETSTARIENPNSSHAKKFIENLLTLQNENEINIDEMIEEIKDEFGNEDIIWTLEDCFDSWEGYKENTDKILSTWNGDEEMDDDEKRECGKYDNYIEPTDEEKDNFEEWAKTNYVDYFENEYKELGKEENESVPFWMMMEFRNINDFKNKATNILSKAEKILNDDKYQFENKFFFANQDTGLGNSTENMKSISWDGAMVTKNKLNALIHDYGQMKADAAKTGNVEFMLALDSEIKENFKENPEIAKTIIQLATIRSFSELIACMEKGEEKPENKSLAIDELKKIIEL
ncbi:hypothetical protein KAI92_04215 [Candidatus Parcubacteria bacterium]|nr:hypothetical protein [Candidatus Parcubacteria bacterium]